MDTKKEYPMTQEGYDKLEKDLEIYKTEKRPEVVEKIKVARSFGDLSENSEYDAAKDEQGFIEQEITKMETMLRHAVIIEANKNSDEVQLGKMVTFIEVPDGDEESYQIVGSAEADPFEGKISNESPIAKTLLGKKVGDKVTVPLPNGSSMDVEIKSVK
ncbi:transcription elongation factor GreA [Abyssicoccus albus]|uniref:Transcription elongation factor GreA n=1 Tax=Abyssicoccus albus TaxID=1817405 RepID=A0A1Q1G0Z6_9BACL|nr:transcription elongation factor GreA [Abyssicoccus albus]AQL56028.1 transcription elongation factor GreA [Abyssicoccus albus]RPF58169.1 transcription elongation factor GreA [Abyssicoccus albus]